MIRVVLPYHLRTLARVDGEVQVEVQSPPTLCAVLDALEARYPALRGTIRDHGTLKRRPFVRFFACKEDLSLEPPETKLPDAVVEGCFLELAEPDIATPVWSGVEDHATPGSGFQAASICAWAKSPFTTRFWAEAVRRKDRPRQTKARERALFEKIVKAMSPLFPLSE